MTHEKLQRVKEIRNEILVELIVGEGEPSEYSNEFHDCLDNAQAALKSAVEAGEGDVIQEVIDENEGGWIEDHRDGETGAINFAVGQVMQKVGGTMDPGKAHRELKRRVEREND